jgi:NTP pyrophosphatase (non-canonical NTP hydrolase)
VTGDVTLAELAEKLARVSDVYAGRHGVDRDDDWYALKLQEECGELTAEYLRLTGRARGGGPPTATLALADEAADLLAHVLLFCRRNRIDVGAALHRKWLRHLEEAPTP